MIIEKKSSVIRYIVLLVLVATSALLWPDATVKAQNISPAATTSSNEFLNTLSQEEREWLRAHPVIRVFQDPDWPPIEFADERGNPTGMTKDYLSLIEQRLGQKFEPVLHLGFQEALARMKRGEIDMTTTVAETPERLQYLAFTQPYMTIPIVIATQQNVTYISNLNELTGKKVAAVEGFAVHEWIQKDFPDVRLLKVKTSLEGLQRVEHGEIDAFIDGLVTIGYHQTKRDVLNLKIAGATPYFNAQRMAVRKDWAPFAGILQKALDSISATERDAIFRKWLPLQYQSTFDYTRLWPVAAILAIAFLGLGLWNWKLAAEIRLRKQTAEALRHTQALLANAEKLGQVGGWEFDVQTLQTTWTEGVYSIHELDSTHRVTLDEGINYYTPASLPMIEQAVQRALEQGEPFDLELEIITAKGNRRHVHTVGKPDLARGKVTGFFQDISARKQADLSITQSEQRLELAVGGAGLGLWDWHAPTGELTVNDRWRSMLGLDPAGPMPTIDLWNSLVHVDDLPNLDQLFKDVIMNPTGRDFEIEIRARHRDGHYLWIFDKGHVAERAADGSPLRVVGTHLDISERKHAAILLAESESQRLAEMSAALEAQRQSSRAALSLMEDAIAARQQAVNLSVALNEQLDELRRWQQVTINRESRILSVKMEINDLLAEHGQPPRYPSALNEGTQA